jgi:hypothetical protein
VSAAAVLPPALERRRARACSVCGELGHRADNARHKGGLPAELVAGAGTPAPPAMPATASFPRPLDDPALATRAIDRARARATTTADGRHRSKTIPATARTGERRALALAVLNEDEFPDIRRPLTRGDCAEVLRPCPFVSCAHHLYLDVDQVSGALKLNYPHLEPWELGESCSLDVADRGGATLEEVGTLVSVTRERARQIEEKSIAKLRLRAPELAEPVTRTAEAASCNGVI